MSRITVAIPAWRFSVSTGRWDQFAKFGKFEKDGASVVFDKKTLGQIIDNFAGRQNDLGMDHEHQALNAPLNGQPAPALAWYSALALVFRNQLVRFASHDQGVQKPDPAGLEDGLYGFRAHVTPLGEQLLPNYRYISPAFTTDGANQKGEPVGYDLLNIAATNTPFLDGMAPIEMRAFGGPTIMGAPPAGASFQVGDRVRITRGPQSGKIGRVQDYQTNGNPNDRYLVVQLEDGVSVRVAEDNVEMAFTRFNGGTMDPNLLKKLGLAEGCSPDDKMAKYVAYAMGEASPDEIKAMADDIDRVEDPAAKTMAAKLRKLAAVGVDEEPEEPEEEEKAKVEMSRHLGGKATWRGALEQFTANRHTTVDKAELVPLKAKVAELEKKLAERELGERESAILSFARDAIAGGSWDPGDEAGLVEFRRSAPDAAAKNVEKNKGRWKALQSFTAGGHPIAKGPGASGAGKASGRGAELAAAAAAIVDNDPELLKLSRTNRPEAMTRAMDLAYAKDPSLYR